jgi:hypothetical protein
MLDILDHLPCMRISDALMEMIIWVLRECGVQDTPLFYALHKVQKQLQEKQGIPCNKYKSVQGNIFYVNDLRAIIAQVSLTSLDYIKYADLFSSLTQDWMNPLMRSHIHLYSEIPANGIICEVWHADKWHIEMDPDVLSPMYTGSGSHHYYIWELCHLKDRRLVIPI